MTMPAETWLAESGHVDEEIRLEKALPICWSMCGGHVDYKRHGDVGYYWGLHSPEKTDINILILVQKYV